MTVYSISEKVLVIFAKVVALRYQHLTTVSQMIFFSEMPMLLSGIDKDYVYYTTLHVYYTTMQRLK